jgi:subtilisin family serine protease
LVRRRLLIAGSLVFAFAAGILAPAGADAAPAERYIVVLKGGTDSTATASDHEERRGADVEYVYKHSIKGYTAKIPSSQVASIRADSRVAYVERDGIVQVTAQTLPWGIDRIDADVSSTKAGNGSGSISNVNTYIIDTGVYAHSDINLVKHVNFAGGSNKDCNGHGTHVAGTVAARDNSSYVVGVAPGAKVTGVKVLGCDGSGYWSNVIKGIDWVTANATKPAIANMSLTGSLSQALDDAVRRSVASGVFYSLAAGNDGKDACTSSPARAGAGSNNGIVTVAATDSAEKEASWSNYGSCVDIWAPGVNVISTRKSGGTTTMSGTSMAAPHVGGGGALYLSTHPSSTPTEVETAMRSAAHLTGTLSKNAAPISREYVGGF